ESGSPDRGGDLRMQHLDGDGTAVFFVLGEIDDGHAAPTQLPLHAVPFGETSTETLGDVVERWHGVQATAPAPLCLLEAAVEAPGARARDAYIEEQAHRVTGRPVTVVVPPPA